jgi:hypothetical protein
MDINFWSIGFGTIGLLLLALFIFFSISGKSIWSGLIVVAVLSIVLLLIAIPTVGLLGLIFVFPLIPEETQLNIGWFFTFTGLFCVTVFSIIPSIRKRKMAGDFVDKEQRKIAQLTQVAVGFLLQYCSLTVLIDVVHRMNAYESYRRNIFWWIVIICLALYSYYSFEYREKGFVHRGKVILFSNIGYARWENPWTKMKLKVRLKDTKQETTLKIPSDMSASVNDYVKAHFPRP